jgi:hypothetical protein
LLYEIRRPPNRLSFAGIGHGGADGIPFGRDDRDVWIWLIGQTEQLAEDLGVPADHHTIEGSRWPRLEGPTASFASGYSIDEAHAEAIARADEQILTESVTRHVTK